MNEKWDRRFLEMAELVAGWSKDPSTKVGSVIARGKVQISSGYNGLPAGLDDLPERLEDKDLKNKLTLHAEHNAVLYALQGLHGCTCYSTVMPCTACAVMLIQVGIKRVVAYPLPEHMKPRWQPSMDLAADLFKEAGVELVLY